MSKRSQVDQLDQAIQLVLGQREAESSPQAEKLEPNLAMLLRIAEDLRYLPRENFKARLKSDLERKASMSTIAEPKTTASSFIPEGFHTVTPYLVADDAAGLIDFVKHVFDAGETFRTIGSAGGIHCQLRIGDSKLMIGGGGPGLSWSGPKNPAALHIYVENADAVYQRAVGAGGVSIQAPADQSYGERSASVRDQSGNHWYIATYKGEGDKPQGLNTVTPYLHPIRAEPVINFLKHAFGAEEVAKYASPDGVIMHASVKIGDSIMEMGEAHGPYQPMSSMFYLYVPDVDATYLRAMAAGAESTGEPKDQPYGDRTASVKDVFGNQWYIATHIKNVPERQSEKS